MYRALNTEIWSWIRYITLRSTGCWRFVVWYPDVNVYQESASYIFRVYTLVLPKCWYVHRPQNMKRSPLGGVRVWHSAGTVGYGHNRLLHYHTQTGNDEHFRGVLRASTLCECFQDRRYMEHPRWCNIHKVYLCYQSHTMHSLWVYLYIFIYISMYF